MKLDGYLRAHEFMRVERPPNLGEADTEEVPFLYLLGEMIVVGLNRGNELEDLTLNASNVTVRTGPAEGTGPPPGDYVALTVRGSGDWTPEWLWPPGESSRNKVYCNVEARVPQSGAVYAYSRQLDGEGSVTVYLRRLRAP